MASCSAGSYRHASGSSFVGFRTSDGESFVTPTIPWPRQVCFFDMRQPSLIAPLYQFVSERVYEARTQMNGGTLGDPEKLNLLQRLLQHQYAGLHPVPDCDIISECMGHL